LDNQNNSQLLCRTMLFIMPGYDFKVINGIITNYHLPKSTLILLVAAFTGKDLWRSIYNSALENNYRFLSYGDSSFLFKENSNTIIN
jgi:S-adenosylmethionine:tRNA ribosyltransferase-isomerase